MQLLDLAGLNNAGADAHRTEIVPGADLIAAGLRQPIAAVQKRRRIDFGVLALKDGLAGGIPCDHAVFRTQLPERIGGNLLISGILPGVVEALGLGGGQRQSDGIGFGHIDIVSSDLNNGVELKYHVKDRKRHE